MRAMICQPMSGKTDEEIVNRGLFFLAKSLEKM